MTRLHLSQKARHNLSLLLQEHCRSLNGKAVYAEGFNDARLAELIIEKGDACTAAHVNRVRSEIFGPLHNGPVQDPALEAKVENLVARIEKLEALLEKVTPLHGGL